MPNVLEPLAILLMTLGKRQTSKIKTDKDYLNWKVVLKTLTICYLNILFKNFWDGRSFTLSHAISFPSTVSYLHHSNCWVNLWRQWNVNLILISIHTKKVKKSLTNTFKIFSKLIIMYSIYISSLNPHDYPRASVSSI